MLAPHVDGNSVHSTSPACDGAPSKPNGRCWITNEELTNRPTGLCLLLRVCCGLILFFPRLRNVAMAQQATLDDRFHTRVRITEASPRGGARRTRVMGSFATPVKWRQTALVGVLLAFGAFCVGFGMFDVKCTNDSPGPGASCNVSRDGTRSRRRMSPAKRPGGQPSLQFLSVLYGARREKGCEAGGV